MKKRIAVLSFMLIGFNVLVAQNFTHADTLRGSNGPGRSWWNATKYDLHVKFDFGDSSISGYNVISYAPLTKNHAGYFQIDLQEPMQMDSAILETGSLQYPLHKTKLSFTRDGNVFFVYLPDTPVITAKHDINTIMITAKSAKAKPAANLIPEVFNLVIYYHGKPRIAKKAPWDGGFVWKRDKAGNPWVGVTSQGWGASVWYPCKDYQGDEPDSAEMHFTAPSDLITVSNGRLRSIKIAGDGNSVYTWAVVSPINNYDITFYIGKYVHFGQIYKGEKGNLTMDYWVLDSNLTKAKEQFKDAPRMMKAFEYWFGPYPFYKDGYKLVDAPYLGMEHQSAIAYGNHYLEGYAGRDLSGSGWGLKWDFIIVHESAHEWFGNNITSKDLADMWIHESFANYAEALFTEYYYGKKAGDEYVIGVRKNIRNDKPIIAHYGVNEEGSGDMYYKGGNMIHTIRQIINNDVKFRNILRGLNKTFYHQTVTTKQVEDYISHQAGINFSKVFDQYLRTTKIPELEYKKEKGRVYYRWTNCVDGFNMPVKIYDQSGKLIFIYPTEKYREAKANVKDIKVDENFYVTTKDESEQDNE
ncbi:MAG: M1 family metallopeptidase [Bacteroidota bacterium]|nr:M1 family metallopeptidase [Bacteroidota bacterium]